MQTFMCIIFKMFFPVDITKIIYMQWNNSSLFLGLDFFSLSLNQLRFIDGPPLLFSPDGFWDKIERI